MALRIYVTSSLFRQFHFLVSENSLNNHLSCFCLVIMRTSKPHEKALAALVISAFPTLARASQRKFFPWKNAKSSPELSSCLPVSKHLRSSARAPSETYYSRQMSAEQTKQNTAETDAGPTGKAVIVAALGTMSDFLVSSLTSLNRLAIWRHRWKTW